AQRLGGDGDDHPVGAVERLVEVGGAVDGPGQVVLREVGAVAVLLADLAGDLLAAGPEHDLRAAVGQDAGEGGAPAAGTEHGAAPSAPAGASSASGRAGRPRTGRGRWCGGR